ncbi:MAG TPA: hypothetical protein VMN60_05190 [Longimicrobiales bacterium]|nr:hypothetical protein [Longimicrobiales bacterium]
MRSATALLAVVLIIGCQSDDAAPADDEPVPAAEATPTAPTLAEFAGTWQNSVTLNGVPDPVPSTLTGTAAGNDWTMSLEGRPSIPLTVSIVGDSLISQSAEYESILRPGVMVTVRTASVLRNGMLEGTVIATYRTPTGEEVVNGTLTGTRTQ